MHGRELESLFLNQTEEYVFLHMEEGMAESPRLIRESEESTAILLPAYTF
jgi:hypothetical protein